jgi:hypothetical protein
MTTDLFFVAPSEAMLLGLCLGEYLQMRTTHDSLSFTQVKDVRITQFVPHLSNYRRRSISHGDIPDDLEDIESPMQGIFRGRRSAEPNTFYGVDAEGAYRRTVVFKKNFEWLLTVYLGPHVGYPDWYRPILKKMARDNPDGLTIESELAAGNARLTLDSGSFYGQLDEPLRIEEAVVRLIDFNEMRRFFDLGRYFGTMNAGIQQYESANDRKSSQDSFAAIIKGYSQLAEAPEVKRCSVAYSAIESLWHRLWAELNVWTALFMARNDSSEGIPIFGELSNEQREQLRDASRQRDAGQVKTKSDLQMYRHILWVAFGEVLGSIRDLDQSAKEHDSESIAPRTFGVGRNDTPDRIRKWLGDAERELAYGVGDIGTPEKVVISLKDSIEALAKRLWKTEFDSQYRGASGLPSLLVTKARTGQSPQERRFGQVALSLYYGYRNEATHEQDSFSCTISEARHFISGIRVLLDLFHEIIGRSKT